MKKKHILMNGVICTFQTFPCVYDILWSSIISYLEIRSKKDSGHQAFHHTKIVHKTRISNKGGGGKNEGNFDEEYLRKKRMQFHWRHI